jgi:hypothetical protein
MRAKQDSLARRGIRLPRRALRSLDEAGIFVQSSVSLEHQQQAGRYVVRGIESGGAVKNFGRYITFCGPDGEPLPYLHPIDSIGVNGVHAILVAPVLVRIELFRVGRTCQLAITRHEAGKTENGKRPRLESSLLFRGVNGFLEPGPLADPGALVGFAIPRFWSRGGEMIDIPKVFAEGVQAATKGASCVGCSHAHFLVPPAGASLCPHAVLNGCEA